MSAVRYSHCFHSGAWRTWWEDNDPDTNSAIGAARQQGILYDKAICADWIGCDAEGVACAARGLACSNENCVAECSANASCNPNGGFPLKYPNGFICSANQTCILP